MFLSVCLVVLSLGAFAQLKMNSSGKVGIGGDPASAYFVNVTSTSGNNGIDVTLPRGGTGSLYGVFSSFTNSLNGSINRSVYGESYSTTASSSGQAYGVYGIAGNSTDGYNFGVFGQLLGTKSGASVYGTIGTFNGVPNDLAVANTQYAGYFVGNVKMTGSIWAAGGTITGSDERIKKNISVLDCSDNIFKLMPKQYKLKSPKELFSDKKITSDTAKIVVDNNPDSEDYNKYHYGFLAQELQLVYPDLVYTSPDGTLGVDYQGLIPMIIDQLQKMKQSLKEKDDIIATLVAGLENCCGSSSLKNASLATGITSSLAENVAQLDQNIPNPFSQKTSIGCTIPENSATSVLFIYNMNGTQLQQYNVNGKGKQTVTISGNSLDPGMYLYALVVDGKEVDTKRMILTK